MPEIRDRDIEQYRIKPSLSSVLITRATAESLKQLFLSRKRDINLHLQNLGYKRHDSTSKLIELSNIYIGVIPEAKKVPQYPFISIFVTGRSPNWWASRMTKDDITARIFCCVQNTDAEVSEKLMYDFTEICVSILFSSPTLPIYMVEDGDGSEVEVLLHRHSTSLPSVTYGLLSNDYIKAGQIDWTGEILLNHPNMIF